MSLTVDLPPDVERGLREEAARKGQAPEALAGAVTAERFDPSARAARLRTLFDRWNAEDEANPEPGDPPIPPRLSLRVPNIG